MYLANIEASQEGDPSEVIITDMSTGDETATSRKIEVTKTDLIVVEYPFVDDDTTVTLTGFDKDYALSVKFIATVDTPEEGSILEKELEFVMLGYAKKGFTQRKIDLEVDDSVIDKRAHREQSNDIIYYMEVAEDCVRFSDLVGAQKALDYIKEIVDAGVNSN
jgi:hypothetical protein